MMLCLPNRAGRNNLRKVFMESKQWFCRGSTIPLKAALISASGLLLDGQFLSTENDQKGLCFAVYQKVIK